MPPLGLEFGSDLADGSVRVQGVFSEGRAAGIIVDDVFRLVNGKLAAEALASWRRDGIPAELTIELDRGPDRLTVCIGPQAPANTEAEEPASVPQPISVLEEIEPTTLADLVAASMATNPPNVSHQPTSDFPEEISAPETLLNVSRANELSAELAWRLDPFDARHPLPPADDSLRVYSPQSRFQDSLGARRFRETVAWQEQRKRDRNVGCAIDHDYDVFRDHGDDYNPFAEPEVW
jgi:hypothetical protein